MKAFLTKKLITVALLAPLLLNYSCKKVSPIAIDNDEVIQTPYGLYIANTNGMLINTNDGYHMDHVFPADGYAPTAIVTSANNLMMIKENLHASFNNGKNFQMVFNKVSHQKWQEQIIDAPLQNRLYVTTTLGKGVAFSPDNGRNWEVDNNFHPLIPVDYKVTSFAAMNDGSVYSFSNINLLLMKKDNADAQWTPVTVEGIFPADLGEYFLGGDGQTLFLLESTGKFFHYFSEDGGAHWTKLIYSDIPYGTAVHTVAKAPGGNMLIGTSVGIYRFEAPDRLVRNNNGLEIGTDVKRMVVKKNVYKNNVTKYFMFAATNKGLFRSEDRGWNWVRTTDSTFQHNYNAMY